MSMDMSKQVQQKNLHSVASLGEFDPLAGGGQRRPSANDFMNNNNSNNNNSFDPFSSFGNNATATQQPATMQPQRTMNVGQAFGTSGQSQQQQRQQQMAGLGQQVFQMGFGNQPQQQQPQQQQQQQDNSGGFGDFFGDDAFGEIEHWDQQMGYRGRQIAYRCRQITYRGREIDRLSEPGLE